jgi:hypothetical protein
LGRRALEAAPSRCSEAVSARISSGQSAGRPCVHRGEPHLGKTWRQGREGRAVRGTSSGRVRKKRGVVQASTHPPDPLPAVARIAKRRHFSTERTAEKSTSQQELLRLFASRLFCLDFNRSSLRNPGFSDWWFSSGAWLTTG